MVTLKKKPGWYIFQRNGQVRNGTTNTSARGANRGGKGGQVSEGRSAAVHCVGPVQACPLHNSAQLPRLLTSMASKDGATSNRGSVSGGEEEG